jgi:acyl-coenzyme A thioesterase PaaI-like protein
VTSVEGPPSGFIESTTRGPFTTHNGPVYHKPADAFVRGFRALHRHCNSFGIVHGGWLMTFTDGVLGAAVWEATKTRSVTLRMTSDFVGMVRQGEWVEGRGLVTRATRSLVFARAELTAGGKVVLTAEGVFKLMTGGKRRGSQV